MNRRTEHRIKGLSEESEILLSRPVTDFVYAMSEKAAGAASVTTANGDNGAGGDHAPQPPVVTPDMMFKISKKIAQLTKVIYSLNTRNDDLELELEGLRANYEQRLAEAVAELQATDGRGEADGAENVGAAVGGGACGTLNGDAGEKCCVFQGKFSDI